MLKLLLLALLAAAQAASSANLADSDHATQTAAVPPARSPDQVAALLRAKDQALLDAFASGNTKIWDTALSADAIYVDENGEIMPRAEFLKQLTPLPPGASGKLVISKYSVTLHGDVATVIHTDDEEENYHGQQLNAQYLTTETWRQEAGDWKLLLVHTYAVLKDPPAVKLSTQELDGYAGKYSAGDLVYVIRREGDHLVGGREGKPAVTLYTEVRDVFFTPGQPRIRKIFQRTFDGKIVGFSDRRESWDLVWKKTE